MRRSRLLALCAALCLTVVPLTPASGSQAVGQAAPEEYVGPPTQPECLPLALGTTGLLGVGDAPTPDQLTGRRGGFGAPAPARIARTLPDRIVFRDNRDTFGAEHAFALRGGRIYVRPATQGRGRAGEPWRVLELPTCLDGHVSAISADHRLLLALGRGKQVYSHNMPGGDLSKERWTWRWGPYLWTGSGMRMFRDVRRWSASEFTAAETFRDTSGREQHPIGVATVYLLRGDTRRITYLDPWLPQDESREVCGPRRGTTYLAGLSGSGSTVFAAGERGGLFTRLYDFDVSGANTVFGDYSWEQGRPADDTRWQLPGPTWQGHRPPPGVYTDRVSISKTGAAAADRSLRVEGRDRTGRTGFWHKPLTARTWRFTPTGERLRGRRLPLARPHRASAPRDVRFAGTASSSLAVVDDFNAECSPATLRVRVAPRTWLTLRLHTSDGLRQERRGPGLDDVPREYNGAIEVPLPTWRSLHRADPRVRRWVAEHLDGRFTTAPVAVTRTRMRFLDQCWELTLDGRPARPDRPALPPDSGAAVGRLTEMLKDGRAPSACAG